MEPREIMKHILLAILLTFSTLSIAEPVGKIYNYKLDKVIDGDTVSFVAPFLPEPIKPVLSIRIYGIDTPEKGFRAKCPSENTRGLAATEFTKKAVASAKVVQFEIIDWDKFGGRVLGDVILDGKRLSEMLIQENLARPYLGEAKKTWCNI